MTSPVHNEAIEWLPIDTAPDLERVFVAGWQPRHARTQGYWWWHEDTAYAGRAVEHPDALYWAPIHLPMPLPSHDAGAA